MESNAIKVSIITITVVTGMHSLHCIFVLGLPHEHTQSWPVTTNRRIDDDHKQINVSSKHLLITRYYFLYYYY